MVESLNTLQHENLPLRETESKKELPENVVESPSVQDDDGPVLAVPCNKDEPVDEVQEEDGLVAADVQDEVGLAVADVFGEEETVPPDEREEGCPVETDDNDEDDGDQVNDKAGPSPDNKRDEGDPAETDADDKEPLSVSSVKVQFLVKVSVKNQVLVQVQLDIEFQVEVLMISKLKLCYL